MPDLKNKMGSSSGKHWRELCAEASEEPDSERVISLVNQILRAFEECDQRLSTPKPPADVLSEA
jgi:hypothetical protein